MGFWRPEFREFPEASFKKPVLPPGPDPSDPPVFCIRINRAWLIYLAGAALQLVQPPSWNLPEGADLQTALAQAEDVLWLITQAEACEMVELRYTADCHLQLSLDGGATWATIPGWDEYFPQCVKAIIRESGQGQVIMAPGITSPPVPVWNADGTDWLYTA